MQIHCLYIYVGRKKKQTHQRPARKASLAASYDAKSIRLDVRTSDPEHEYDIEMQTTDKKDLPLRARYYQSLMDIESTQRRGHS